MNGLMLSLEETIEKLNKLKCLVNGTKNPDLSIRSSSPLLPNGFQTNISHSLRSIEEGSRDVCLNRLSNTLTELNSILDTACSFEYSK